MTFRFANAWDVALLAGLNHELIRDEGHRNRMTVPELEDRMKGWLAGEYCAVIFLEGGETVGYALYRENADEIYLRQFFIVKPRRRNGLGRLAMDHLFHQVWPKTKRLTVDVLTSNQDAIRFWRSVGYQDYCLALEILPRQSKLKPVT